MPITLKQQVVCKYKYVLTFSIAQNSTTHSCVILQYFPKTLCIYLGFITYFFSTWTFIACTFFFAVHLLEFTRQNDTRIISEIFNLTKKKFRKIYLHFSIESFGSSTMFNGFHSLCIFKTVKLLKILTEISKLHLFLIKNWCKNYTLVSSSSAISILVKCWFPGIRNLRKFNKVVQATNLHVFEKVLLRLQ